MVTSSGWRRAVAGLVAGLALATTGVWSEPAHAAGPTTFSNTAAMTLTSPAHVGDPAVAASVYPSPITVSGMTGVVSDVKVTVNGFSHGLATDVDILLVDPTGHTLMLWSDPGAPGTFVTTSNANVTFDDFASTGIPQTHTTITGPVSYKPTDNDLDGKVDNFPSPAPVSLGSATTFAGAFAGVNPNGAWKLFVVDDTQGDDGSISGGWSITITTTEVAAATTTTLTSAPNPSLVGGPVLLTASVTSGGSPVTAGTVTFSDGGSALGTNVALDGSGHATFTTSSLTERIHSIVATYNGTASFLTSNGTVSQTVDNPTTKPDADTWCNSGVITVPTVGPATPYASHIALSGAGAALTQFSVELHGVGHSAPIDFDIALVGPTGASSMLMSDVGGHAVTSGVNLTFSGTAAATIPAAGPLVSGTFLPSDDDTSGLDSFPAPAPTAPGASLGVFDGTNPNGTWSLYVVDDATGDAGSIAGGWCLNATTAAATTTTVGAAPNPSTSGQSVTLTATVTSSATVNAGTIQFRDGATALGSPVAVNGSGVATFTTSTLTVGPHTINAAYSGTPAFQASNGSTTQVVDLVPTTTALTSSTNPSTFGGSITFTATVTSGGTPVAAGSVTFSDGATPLGPPVTVDASGVATFTTSTLTVGPHTINAAYGGTAAFQASNGSVTQVVDLVTTTTALTSSSNPSTFGGSITFTATVTSGGTPVAAGSVTFSDGATPLGPPVTVDASGVATFTTSTLTAATHTIQAVYSGTPTLASSNATLTQVVGVAADAGGPYTIAEGDPLTLDASTSAAGPGATYSWDVNGDGTFDDATGAAPTLTWAQLEAIGIDDGTGVPSTISVRVVDGTESGIGTAQLTITNVAPSATLSNDGPVAEGHTATVTFAGITDPSPADLAALTYSYDFDDDGTFELADVTDSSATVPAQYLADGPGARTVRAVVADDDGGRLELTTVIAITNAAATATIEGPSTATVGVPVTIKVGAVDPSPGDMAGTFSFTVDWGDGTAAETVTGPADPLVTHTYTAAGTFTVTATATDPDGATSEPTTFTITVAEAPPTTTVEPTTTTVEPTTTTAGPTTTVQPTTTDPGATTLPDSSATIPTGVLPVTGSDSHGSATLALVVVLAGLAAVLAARRRGHRRAG